MNYQRSRHQGRESLKNPQAQAIKASTSQADRLRARLAQLQEASK